MRASLDVVQVRPTAHPSAISSGPVVIFTYFHWFTVVYTSLQVSKAKDDSSVTFEEVSSRDGLGPPEDITLVEGSDSGLTSRGQAGDPIEMPSKTSSLPD